MTLPPDLLTVPAQEVARLARCGSDPRWRAVLEAGIAEARALVAPRARWAPLTREGQDGLFPGGTPVEAIAREGRSWAFIATVGAALEGRVREHFDAGRYLDGVILDAAGSVSVEALCDVVERACAGETASTRFSPGYCMWRLEGQSRIFALLTPGGIGIRLLPSMLMHPLKSVSGVVVTGSPEELLIPAEICEQCDAHGCARRGAV